MSSGLPSGRKFSWCRSVPETVRVWTFYGKNLRWQQICTFDRRSIQGESRLDFSVARDNERREREEEGERESAMNR